MPLGALPIVKNKGPVDSNGNFIPTLSDKNIKSYPYLYLRMFNSTLSKTIGARVEKTPNPFDIVRN